MMRHQRLVLIAAVIFGFTASIHAQDRDANPLTFLGPRQSLETGYLEKPLIFDDGLRVHAITVSAAICKNKALLLVDPNRNSNLYERNKVSIASYRLHWRTLREMGKSNHERLCMGGK